MLDFVAVKNRLSEDIDELIPFGEAVPGKGYFTKDYRAKKLRSLAIGSEMKAYSASFADGNCCVASVLLITRPLNSTQFQALKDGDESADGMTTPEEIHHLAQLKAVAVGSIMGHTEEFIRQFCDNLGISCLRWSEVEDLVDLGPNIHLKERNGLPILPALVILPGGARGPGHVILLTTTGERKGVFSLDQVHNALLHDQDEEVKKEVVVYTNSLETM